ncbi:hypothetical protein [Flavihumibacter petaseus]|uniref:Uncharacterized protein n=1 Tax=Flavihumibacter petaseus NBRC 106054 TaxID=1220578 RepID=A0A0E9MXR5_9BACT|nr:hypothetical protein [Flavihumibacter petaseus]GAO42507.1 hypothetical protein FPE01S_01_15220 [Flavihumibacter petaseus NBRC 106054]
MPTANTLSYLLQGTGVVLIILALLHGVFPKYFRWKAELATLSLVNREIMYVHSFFIALVVLGIGLLCVTASNELIGTPLGRKISAALGVFWLVRLLTQFFGYSRGTWKGKPFETTVHVLFIFLWSYLSALFFLSGLR